MQRLHGCPRRDTTTITATNNNHVAADQPTDRSAEHVAAPNRSTDKPANHTATNQYVHHIATDIPTRQSTQHITTADARAYC